MKTIFLIICLVFSYKIALSGNLENELTAIVSGIASEQSSEIIAAAYPPTHTEAHPELLTEARKTDNDKLVSKTGKARDIRKLFSKILKDPNYRTKLNRRASFSQRHQDQLLRKKRSRRGR